MYRYMNEVEKLVEDFIGIFPEKKTKTFYKSRIIKFFNEYMGQTHNVEKPLKAITSHDLNLYLQQVDKSGAEKLNYYNALKGFFQYTYELDITLDALKGVKVPKVQRKLPKYISPCDVEKIEGFIRDPESAIDDRLLLAFFLYTGLSRQFIANLRNFQVYNETKEYSLHITRGDQFFMIPLKKIIHKLIRIKRRDIERVDPYAKLFNIDENYVSSKVSLLSTKITGKPYTPTMFSNTFIKQALDKNIDIYTISRLTLESLLTIEKHLDKNQDIYDVQKSALKEVFCE